MARLFITVEEGGMWHRHRQGAWPAAPQGLAIDCVTKPRVNDSRWVVDCLFCVSAQLSAPEFDVMFCIDCLNAGARGAWVRVAWPPTEDIAAIEAALEVRPHFDSRNWTPEESIGYLLAENVAHGLVTGDRAAGDIGVDQMRLPGERGLLALGAG